MKPFINLDEITEFDDVEENGLYTSKRALFSAAHRRPAARLQSDGPPARQGAVPLP